MAAQSDTTVMLGPLMERAQQEVLGPEGFIHSGSLRFRRPGDGIDQRLVFWVERHSRFARGRHLLGLRVEVAFTGAAKEMLASMQPADHKPVVAMPIDIIESAAGVRHAVWAFDSERAASDHFNLVTRSLRRAALPYLDARRSLSDLADIVEGQTQKDPQPIDLMNGIGPVAGAAAAMSAGRPNQAIRILELEGARDPYFRPDYAMAFEVVEAHPHP
jgi:hypothetical protein